MHQTPPLYPRAAMERAGLTDLPIKIHLELGASAANSVVLHPHAIDWKPFSGIGVVEPLEDGTDGRFSQV